MEMVKAVSIPGESLDLKLLKIADRVFRISKKYSWVGIYLIEGRELVLHAWRGPGETDHQRIKLGKGICGAAAVLGETIIVPDVSKDSRYLDCFGSTKSEIVVPIKSGEGHVIGEIDIDSDQPNVFDCEDAQFLEEIASLLALILTQTVAPLPVGEQADSMPGARKLSAAHIELLAFRELMAIAASSFDVEEVLDKVVYIAHDLMGYELAAIFEYDPIKNVLLLRKRKGFDESGTQLTTFRPEKNGIVGRVFATGQPALVKDVSKDKDYIKAMPDVKSALSVPIVYQKKTIGVLDVESFKLDGFSNYDMQLMCVLADQAGQAMQIYKLHDRVKAGYQSVLECLANCVDARDPYSSGHSLRVAYYASQMGYCLGLGSNDLQSLHDASLLHDIGKIAVPDAILMKLDKLTDEEYDQIKRHTLHAVKILAPAPSLVDLFQIIYHHHERFDGSGYPDGIAGEKIPLGSRIIAVADAFDAMTSERAYRSALPRDAVISRLENGAGTQFDPEIVSSFVNLLRSSKR